MARLNERDLAEKVSYLIRGMSVFKISQILGVIKDVLTEHIQEEGNSIYLNGIFSAHNIKVNKYDINSNSVKEFSHIKFTTSEKLKNKINERNRNKEIQLQSDSKNPAVKNKKPRGRNHT
jgi:hypothetical protein